MNQFGQGAPQPMPANGGGDNKTMKIVAAGCAVILLLGCCCGGGFAFFGGGLFAALSGPSEAATAWLGDCQSGNFQNALQRMDATYQGSHTAQSMQTAAQALPGLTDHTDVSFPNRNRTNDRATLTGTITNAQGPHQIMITLTQVGEHWYINSVSVDGMPLQ